MQEKKLISMNLMDYPEYKKEWLLLQDLKSKIQGEQRELDKPSANRTQEIAERKQHNINNVLAGKVPEDFSNIDEARNIIYNQAQKRIKIYREAVEQQKKIVQKAKYKVSKEISKEYKPIYKTIIKNMCDAWIKLGEFVIQERELRQNLNDNDVAYISDFTPMVIYGVGDPRVYNSRFSGWLIECCKFNYFKFDDIPKSFKDRWERDGVTKDYIMGN